MKSFLFIFFVLINLPSNIAIRGGGENLVNLGREFLVQICKGLQDLESYESLGKCYHSSLAFSEFLWAISYIIKEKKDFETPMVLPKGIIDNGNCIEINSRQCITLANFSMNDNSIYVQYNKIDNIISPVINLCNLEKNDLSSSLNILWMGNSKKISDLAQGAIIGRGYEEIIQFDDPFHDLSSLICQDVKMYLFTERYRKELIDVIISLLQEDMTPLPISIRNPIYLRIPFKYDQELDLSWFHCQDLQHNLRKLDGLYDQIKLDMHGKTIIVNKATIGDCEPGNIVEMIAIAWRVED
ncbi:putative signal peptide-containing secreted protein [Cryptosporidium canis]|uniref:Signal peptide-containing secreted protein n=1 Tax=Cryptosporidium canis TaxID=195482 RepID=A0ABQ8PAS8_9CRYT|nr:putative signal peptide-containing secreted protein [Cryptosporidium canis]KAJ1614664.1 putative signal peptide-containing secreted protein [Cryptosporidium canis]